MISITKLFTGDSEPNDKLRYGGNRCGDAVPVMDRRPVVVWNCTKRCNLVCSHCYARSDEAKGDYELSTVEGKALLDDLAQFGSPVILFSGGEPLSRPDLPELAEYAVQKGLRATISTNGTLIDEKMAARLKEINLSYVGISIDGSEETHDKFRQRKGAYAKAVQGVRNCLAAGLKVGLRFTITKDNMQDIPNVFDLMEKENIPRICFYHLVNTGRGEDISGSLLNHEETAQVVDYIVERTLELKKKNSALEVLTVDNSADGPYLYLKMQAENNPKAEEVYHLLKRNGGYSSGVGIGCVSWNGDVYPDQFWRQHKLGNVLERPFSEIWQDTSNPLMAGLKKRHEMVEGRCAECKFLEICGGNFRARGEAATGSLWGPDPACYLSDEEIKK